MDMIRSGRYGALLAVWFAVVAVATAQELRLTSPDASHEVRFYQTAVTDGVCELRYSIAYRGTEVITDARAGLEMDNEVWEKALGFRSLEQPESWMHRLVADSVSLTTEVDTLWHNAYGERSTVRDHYRTATLHLSRHDESDYRLDVEVRAYDEGIAFRYFLPEHKKAIFHKVVDDLTEYRFPAGTRAWAERWAQATFTHGSLAELTQPVERALTLDLPSGLWVALTDADVDDWCLTKYEVSPTDTNTLRSVMYSPVDVVTYCATPWKVVMVADTPGQLIEHNDIILNLNPSCAVPDAAEWVCPGKIMRANISTEAGLRVIDFCAEHKIPYMLFDWQWYMPCTSHDGDATQVVDKLDLPRVIAYGKERGVGVWLYVNQHALMRQAHELFPLLREWGVVGVKSGFVQYASHRWATWLHDLVRLAADNHLMMNIHDEFRPSGFSRTYPNLLTQEGICGNEEWPDATHNATLPFTRMLNGAADYTICYFDKRLRNTHAHQLAASLIMFSPLQTIFWYDTPERCAPVPELRWFELLPTTFDDTRVISGYPGEHIVMARRKGDTWYAALMTGNEGTLQMLPLDFLSGDTLYLAQVYTDDPTLTTPTKVRCAEYVVQAGQTMQFDLLPRGGATVRLTPIDKKMAKSYTRYRNTNKL